MLALTASAGSTPVLVISRTGVSGSPIGRSEKSPVRSVLNVVRGIELSTVTLTLAESLAGVLSVSALEMFAFSVEVPNASALRVNE